MDLHDSGTAEQAILAALTGTPIAEAAALARMSPGRLAKAVKQYRTAGRATLDAQERPFEWHQVNIEFTDYPTAERAFHVYLLPTLRQATDSGTVRDWWFVRKHPCWRLRAAPGPETAAEDVSKRLAEVLDSALSRGVVKHWWSSPYEPEATAFGGPDGMKAAHSLFHADSVGVLNYLHHSAADTNGLLDAKTTSLLIVTLFFRAAGLEWSEQGDVWARVEAKRPLPVDVPVEHVTAMTNPLSRLLSIDARPALGPGGPLAPLAEWVAGMEHAGRALLDAGSEGQLSLGTRGILARHVIFHWNRMGFSALQQSIWARAARQAVLGD
ncbi:thiopeptide-type bacteriocin biosynthesis protein [Streptomyces chrestomyceticus]|uniref:thiopeptide-type bacteriocin biosynthesis protein n=1 Tax=Streptomyces chrestomyceticus TaxID=68185 RepID=UPI0036C12529